MLYGALPAGLALAGPLIQYASAQATVFVLGLVILVIGLTLHPHVRNARAGEALPPDPVAVSGEATGAR